MLISERQGVTMYIELYFIDNFVMNLLILLLAAAVLKRRTTVRRLIAFAALGGVYAVLSVTYLHVLMTPILKPVLLLVMSLAIPFHSIKAYALNVLSVFLSTAVAGGTAYAIASMFGSGESGGVVYGGVELRVALFTALLIAVLPRFIRAIQRKNSVRRVRIRIEHKGTVTEVSGIVDSGNTLCEPLSGKCVIVLYAPELLPFAILPIPCTTASGNAILYGFFPEKLIIDDGKPHPCDAFVALSTQKLSDSLVPETALPYIIETDIKEELQC